jgi:hypothetical protein
MKAPTFVFVLLLTAMLHGQVPMHGSEPGDMVQLLPADSSVLELREPRSDLPCTVRSVKPHLGFDLKFHSGYQVYIPLRELAGSGDAVTMIFRVTPESGRRNRFTSFKGLTSRLLERMPEAMCSWRVRSI